MTPPPFRIIRGLEPFEPTLESAETLEAAREAAQGLADTLRKRLAIAERGVWYGEECQRIVEYVEPR